MRGTPLQFGDLVTQALEIALLIQQTGAQLDHALGGAGHAFAEPQRPRVVFFRVIHGLERARPNALHVPQMEKFVCGYARQSPRAVGQSVRIQIDRGRESVLHPTAAGPTRKVVEKHIGVEGTVIHPTGGGGYDLVQLANDLRNVVVGRFRVHDHAIVSAAFVEIRFLKTSDLHRRIHQPVIIFRAESSIGQRGKRRGDVPSLGHTVEAHRHGCAASIHGIHENLRQIKKGMMRIKLRTERSE